jgi:hypothetical protein
MYERLTYTVTTSSSIPSPWDNRKNNKWEEPANRKLSLTLDQIEEKLKNLIDALQTPDGNLQVFSGLTIGENNEFTPNWTPTAECDE